MTVGIVPLRLLTEVAPEVVNKGRTAAPPAPAPRLHPQTEVMAALTAVARAAAARTVDRTVEVTEAPRLVARLVAPLAILVPSLVECKEQRISLTLLTDLFTSARPSTRKVVKPVLVEISIRTATSLLLWVSFVSRSAKLCTQITIIDVGRYGDPNAKSDLCGKTVHITNTDNGQSVDVTIVDACPTCENNDSIDLSPAAFDTIADPVTGVVPSKFFVMLYRFFSFMSLNLVSWSFTS
jgi:predicted RNA-binding protein with TRAM domain